jgi:RND family efflux transporter MFP subunit
MRNAAFLLAAALLACNAPSGSADDPSGSARVPRISAQTPDSVDFDQKVTLPASIEGIEVAPIYAQVTGYLQTMAVDIGDEVEKDDELAVIAVPELSAQLKRARAAVAKAKANVDVAQARWDIANVEAERLSSLRAKDAGAVAKHDVEVKAARARQAKAEHAAAKAELGEAQAEITRLQSRKDFSIIKAPFDGRISQRNLHPGSLVREGTSSDAEPVLEVVRTAQLRLIFYVPETLVPHVKPKQVVTVSPDALPGRAFEAEVTRTAGALDPQTRSMRVEIELANEDGELQPGMFANVFLSATRLTDALTLPSKAVRGRGEERYVFVVEDGVIVRKDVVVAADDGRKAVLSGGIDGSARVMIAGSPLVQAGSRVEILEDAK